MNPPPDREEALFNAAVQLTSQSARIAFLDQVCSRDTALRQRLDALLREHDAATSFLEPQLGPTAIARAPSASRPADGPGTKIGRYKLLQQVGAGGMGIVYMAEQEEPVRRRVALKIIKLGMDTRQVIARFEAERQALAMMDHPNIARVLDGGATEMGRPYFVMELVHGVPITDFCDKAKLSAKDRLKLFIQVCQAVQHAHQKGIIHRDIKPSNVLVTLHDGVPVPKVIDFGVAKATNQKLTEKTLFTNFATMIGTPAYMSPEQAEMSGLDVDTRTDIYALGVLLYQLLTGTTPFPEKRLRSLGYGEMQRVIMEEEPERPSTRLSTMASEQKTVVAQNCGEEVASLTDLLRGDLDWIVMKCLEKDRQRRYETANGLATDIQRHLSNEPVTARPPSAAYRFQKMVRRNKGTVLATAAVVAALLAALVISVAALVKERKARLEAAEAERAREQARRATEAETVRADTVSRFVVDVFAGALPFLQEQGHAEAIRQLLGVADRLGSGLSNAPLAEATMRLAIGNGYNNDLSKDLSAAEAQYIVAEKRALAAGLAGQHQANLARVRRLQSRMWKVESAEAFRESAKALREMTEFGRACLSLVPPDREAAAEALSEAAAFTTYFGASAEAEALAREALEVASAGETCRFSRIMALNVVASEAAKRGATNEADAYGRRFLEIAAQLESNALETHRDFQRFSGTLTFVGQYRPPKHLLEEALGRLTRSDVPVAAILKGNLGIATACSGDWRRGLGLLQEAVTNRASSIHLWFEATCLAALLADEELRQTLSAYGLARFAAGADPDNGRILAGGLLLGDLDKSMLPVIRELVTRSFSGPPWTRNGGRFQLALLEFRTGRHEEALHVIQNLIRTNERDQRIMYREFIASALYLRSAIEMKLGQSAAALETYRAGDALHSAALRAPGTPHPDLPSGGGFSSARATELMRREAASLLGEVLSGDPQ
jgi:serine/threonine protein kinase